MEKAADGKKRLMEKNAGSQLAASELDFKSAVQLRADIAARRVSPVEVVDRLLERIQAIDGDLNAYWLLNPGARKAAEDAEKALQRNERVGPLHGIPFSVKDLIATAGLRTTRGSAIRATPGIRRSRPAARAAARRQRSPPDWARSRSPRTPPARHVSRLPFAACSA
jgi:hypothetical protein